MIIVYIILAIILASLLVAIIIDWVKHPEDYKETPKPRKKRHTTSSSKWPPLPWLMWFDDND